MVSRTAIQHESSNSLVATVAHSPLGARLRSECRSTMASAPPRPSGASPRTGWFAISWVLPSSLTASRPSAHVATSIVGFIMDCLSLSVLSFSNVYARLMILLGSREAVAFSNARLSTFMHDRLMAFRPRRLRRTRPRQTRRADCRHGADITPPRGIRLRWLAGILLPVPPLSNPSFVHWPATRDQRNGKLGIPPETRRPRQAPLWEL